MNILATKSWRIYKFGGSSLANAACFKQVKSIISEETIVVVSAVYGVTNILEGLIEKALNQNDFEEDLLNLKQKHIELIKELISINKQAAVIASLQLDFNRLEQILMTVSFVKSCSDEIKDLIITSGEKWSAEILSSSITELECEFVSARDLIVAEKESSSVQVNWQESENLINKVEVNSHTKCIVTSGFTARNNKNKTISLGRNGSDYSAAIIARLLAAKTITIWTDVDGIYSANPSLVPLAVKLNEMSYIEAQELAHFGAKVLHPKTLLPIINLDIPIYIKNTFKPELSGSKIHANPKLNGMVKGIAHIDSIVVLNIKRQSLLSSNYTNKRIFELFDRHEIPIYMLSQASAENELCIAVDKSHESKAKNVLLGFFTSNELKGELTSDKSCSIIAVVGENMKGLTGIVAKMSYALARAKVNIKAITQGASECNITLVVDSNDSVRALRVIHSALYLSNRTISIGLIGVGLIGKTFLNQLESELQIINEKFSTDIKVRALMNSTKMLLTDSNFQLNSWSDTFEKSAETADLDRFLNHVKTDEIPHSVLIDCTASESIAKMYLKAIEKGLHIITPNKRANTAELSFYKKLHSLKKSERRLFFYETTVGAALPVIRCLQDLVHTGDELYEIQGVFSGSLSYIFNEYNENTNFSDIVWKAKDLGFTEPDPRDDLSGMDVARKLVILARELGEEVELSDVKVQALIPESFNQLDYEEFKTSLKENDTEFQKRYKELNKEGFVVKYCGIYSKEKALEVKLKSFPISHPFASLKGSDNIIQFTTKRYNSQPLSIIGPGAGADVTAAGVFSDLLRLISELS